jgi:hypothetical protein
MPVLLPSSITVVVLLGGVALPLGVSQLEDDSVLDTGSTTAVDP